MKRVILSVLMALCILIPCNAANDIEALMADIQFFQDPNCWQLKTDVQAKNLESFKSNLRQAT